MNKKEEKKVGIVSGFVKSICVTEKSTFLSSGQFGKKNKDQYKFAKTVFIVDTNATKTSIIQELSQRYQNNKVLSVNTLIVKPKKKRLHGRGKVGYKKAYKKAIVTFEKQLESA